MKKKTRKATEFLDGLIRKVKSTKLNKNIVNERETTNHREVDEPIEKYLRKYFRDNGFKGESIETKVEKYFYKEFDDGNIRLELVEIFGSKSYADFSLTYPYKIAIEYKKGDSGSTFKTGISQCINHTLSGGYDFAILIFSDFSKNEKIKKSTSKKIEKEILLKLWKEFNVKIVFASHK